VRGVQLLSAKRFLLSSNPADAQGVGPGHRKRDPTVVLAPLQLLVLDYFPHLLRDTKKANKHREGFVSFSVLWRCFKKKTVKAEPRARASAAHSDPARSVPHGYKTGGQGREDDHHSLKNNNKWIEERHNYVKHMP
jgi:hypothetical protein